jgi:hypothetical protein
VQSSPKNKIPFKINLEQIFSGIKIMLEKEDIIETNQNNLPYIAKLSSKDEVPKIYKFC